MGSQGRHLSWWHCCTVRIRVPSFWFPRACRRIAPDSAHTRYCLCLRLPPARAKLSSLLFSSTVSGTTILLTIIEHAAPFAGIAAFPGVGPIYCMQGPHSGGRRRRLARGQWQSQPGIETSLPTRANSYASKVRLGHILQVCTRFCRGISHRLKNIA